MKPIFPAVYSTLSPVALGALISEKHKLPSVACKLLVRGVGDTYLIESGDQRFILRIYRSSHRSLSQIRAEIKLLLALKEGGVSVSYPLPDASGSFIQILDAAEGDRYGVLFTYAPGHPVARMNDAQLYNLGREMAAFHNISSGIRLFPGAELGAGEERDTPGGKGDGLSAGEKNEAPGGESRWRFDRETTLFRPLELLRPVFSEIPEEYASLQEIVRKTASKLASFDDAAFSKGYCHFDFLSKNFHFEGDSITLFDFDFFGYGWLVNDLMTLWSQFVLDTFVGRITQEQADREYERFLEGYRSRRSLSEEEIKAIPYLQLGFWLFYMGFHTTHDQFYPYLDPAQLKPRIGALKQLMEKYCDWGG